MCLISNHLATPNVLLLPVCSIMPAPQVTLVAAGMLDLLSPVLPTLRQVGVHHNITLWSGGITQVADGLPNTHEVLHATSSTR